MNSTYVNVKIHVVTDIQIIIQDFKSKENSRCRCEIKIFKIFMVKGKQTVRAQKAFSFLCKHDLLPFDHNY